MFKFIGVVAVLATTYQLPYALEVTASLLLIMCMIFYSLAFKLFVGLSQSALVEEVDILKVLTTYTIYVLMGVVTYQSQYYYIALVAAPWFIIQGLINALSILITLGFIEIKNSK